MWATLEQVTAITGKTVDADTLAMASGIITLYAERTPDMIDKIRARDAYWLAAAASWQAVWMAGQPGVELRNLGTRVETEGLSVDRDSEYSVVLGPLAARALRSLSWKSSRAVFSRPMARRPGGIHNIMLEDQDWYGDWEPL